MDAAIIRGFSIARAKDAAATGSAHDELRFRLTLHVSAATPYDTIHSISHEARAQGPHWPRRPPARVSLARSARGFGRSDAARLSQEFPRASPFYTPAADDAARLPAAMSPPARH